MLPWEGSSDRSLIAKALPDRDNADPTPGVGPRQSESVRLPSIACDRKCTAPSCAVACGAECGSVPTLPRLDFIPLSRCPEIERPQIFVSRSMHARS